jgi:predicted nucleotidyltransferase
VRTQSGLERLWLFGSRAQGTYRERSDVDLAVDAPSWSAGQASAFIESLKQLPMVYPVDAVWWQAPLGETFRAEINAHRVVLWEPAALAHQAQSPGAFVEFKKFQEEGHRAVWPLPDRTAAGAQKAVRTTAALRAAEEPTDSELMRQAQDYPAKAWGRLRSLGLLPPALLASRIPAVSTEPAEPFPTFV